MFSRRTWGVVRLGMRSLRVNGLRTCLTTLGIVLGVASVIVMLSVGEAARYQALKQLEDLGANTIILRSVKPADEPTADSGVDLLAYGLTYADLGRIRDTVPTVTDANPMREFRKTIRSGPRKLEVRIVGATPAFLAQNHIQLAYGRGVSPLDEERFDNIVVLGSEAAAILFPTQNPLGRTISIEDADRLRSFVVVGVTEPKTLSAGGGGDLDYTRVVFIPFATDRGALRPRNRHLHGWVV